jgi:hypothetical protein
MDEVAKTQKHVGYYEAVVRIKLYEGDRKDKPGDWWEYQEPGISKSGAIGACKRDVTEVSSRLLDLNGKPIMRLP